MVWDHLGIDKAHIAYAVIAVFTAVFSLISLFAKEKLYIGEATVASVYGLIVGPHCLNWFAPTSWGNSDYITLELSRIVLVVQIFAVSVELPKKYMAKHALSVVLLLVPVMTAGWLIVGAFIYVLIPGLNFADSLIVSACITATDPVLAAAVVGKGKFAQRVPGHLRNILSAESGCNDGMAFPFIFLGLNLVMHHGHPGEIVKDWICVSILYECVFGCLLGVVIGYCGRHAIKFAEGKNLIDRESFLAFYIVLALMSAGFGAMLGVDDLLVSFAAGAAFSWDGWFARKTEETHVSTVIDLLLNTSYFVYFGAIIPWEQFNNHSIGTDVWRLVVLAIVVLFLRRIPAVLALKPFIPDIKTWREALFCGHFGPIGVGAVYAAIVARAELETLDTTESTPLRALPPEDSEHYQLIACIWPIVTFLIISSIIVHGSSVAVLTLGRHLNSMAISMTFTTTNTANTGTTWLNRLPKLEANGRSFSLQRVDTTAPKKHDGEKQVETSGIKYRPAGGMDRRNRRNRRKNRLSKLRSRQEYLDRNRPEPEQFDLSQLHQRRVNEGANSKLEFEEKSDSSNLDSEAKSTNSKKKAEKTESTTNLLDREASHTNAEPVQAYGEGNRIIVEGHDGEIIDTIDLDLNGKPTRKSAPLEAYRQHQKENIPDDHLVALESNSLLTSSISRVGSRVSNKIKSLPISRLRSNKKAFAYKVDNYLVIENEDGEVIRRYHIHQHADTSNDAARPRSDSIMGKTLKAVGLKKLTSEPDPLGNSSAKATQQIIGDLQDKEETHIVPADETAAVVMSHDLQDADNSLTESEETDESEPDEETEVEKRRRLAALSKRPLPRDEDDEEEAPPTAASK